MEGEHPAQMPMEISPPSYGLFHLGSPLCTHTSPSPPMLLGCSQFQHVRYTAESKCVRGMQRKRGRHEARPGLVKRF